MSRVVVLLSGGMDSAVLLAHHIASGNDVVAIGFDYGQRHNKELAFAQATAHAAQVSMNVVDLSGLAAVLPGSSQTDKSVPVPEGKYDQENMKATVVPNRNMIMLAVAIGHCSAISFDGVSYAAHAGDHAVYPDCREDFALAMEKAAGLCDWRHISLYRPFIDITKADIAAKGADLGVDFSKTWSCYVGDAKHCGRCGTCIERREAFYLAKVEDPTEYGPNSIPTARMVLNDWHIPGA